MQKEKYNFRDGEILLIDKPIGWTSFDVVNKIRFEINYKIPKGFRMKVGHAGTLDPLATGLLIIATGKFTKRLQEFQDQEKEYTGTITLGGNTPTYDAESEVTESFEYKYVTKEEIDIAKEKLVGTIQQVPPIYSAIKINGTRSYKQARKSIDVTPPPRTITVNAFDITSYDLPNLTFRIDCSKGTYIRSMAFDLGALLKTGGYISELRRTKIGDHHVKNALSMDEMVDQIRIFQKELRLNEGL